MSLSEIHNAIKADLGFILESLSKAEDSFSKEVANSSNFPISKRFSYECEKSQIQYSVIFFAPSSSKIMTKGISSSYKNEEGLLTGIAIVPQSRSLAIDVYNPHCIAQYRELVLKNNSLTDEETWNLMREEIELIGKADCAVEVDKNLFEHISGSMEQLSAATVKGVFCGARPSRDKNLVEFGAFLTMDMLSPKQYEDIFNAYLYIYIRQCVSNNPQKEKEINKDYKVLIEKANREQWELDKFAEEGKKLIEKYPLGK